MRRGFWNYSEPIKYRVLLVTLKSPNPNTPMHWQNAFVGQPRQIVEIASDGEKPHIFWIDNEDGSGIQKIEAGGGPGSMSRHIDSGTFEIIEELPLISQWNSWSPSKCKEIDAVIAEWQKTNHPDDYRKLQSLRDKWNSSPMKKLADQGRKKFNKRK